MQQRPTRSARTVGVLAAVVLAGGLAACGSDGTGTGEPGTAVTTAPPSTPVQSGEPGTAEPTSGASEGSATRLTAVLGEPDDPDAYVIGLVDADGEEVTELPAGDYVIEVSDRTDLHNWHLTGPGGVDESTDVTGTEDTTFEVTLEPGTYEYVCDPHPNMTGTFDVV